MSNLDALMVTYNVKLTFITEFLGGTSKDHELFSKFQAAQADNPSDEMETAPNGEMKEGTGFHRLDGKIIIYDYMIRGFFKEAARDMAGVAGSKTKTVKAYIKTIDGKVFVEPRQIVIGNVQEIEPLERPLRAQTAMGPRVTLAKSERIAPGATVEFALKVLPPSMKGANIEELLHEWLSYGMLKGLGQWRNGSYGRFTYELTKQS